MLRIVKPPVGAADGHACVSATKLHNCWNVQAMQIQRQIHVIHTYRNTVTNACRISMQIQASLSASAKLLQTILADIKLIC